MKPVRARYHERHAHPWRLVFGTILFLTCTIGYVLPLLTVQSAYCWSQGLAACFERMWSWLP